MKSFYERENLKISELDAEAVITISGVVNPNEKENAYGFYDEFDRASDSWY